MRGTGHHRSTTHAIHGVGAQPVLETICVPSDLTNNLPPADWDNIPGAYYGCPPGQRNVFPATIIHASHYL